MENYDGYVGVNRTFYITLENLEEITILNIEVYEKMNIQESQDLLVLVSFTQDEYEEIQDIIKTIKLL